MLLDDALAPCATGDIRLVGGNVPYEGRVEICLENEWGSICDIGWDEADASVVCTRLDYLTDGSNPFLILVLLHTPTNSLLVLSGALSYYNASFGQSQGTVLLSSIACNGTESSLLECQYNTSSCAHTQDAGVRCQGVSAIWSFSIVKPCSFYSFQPM